MTKTIWFSTAASTVSIKFNRIQKIVFHPIKLIINILPKITVPAILMFIQKNLE